MRRYRYVMFLPAAILLTVIIVHSSNSGFTSLNEEADIIHEEANGTAEPKVPNRTFAIVYPTYNSTYEDVTHSAELMAKEAGDHLIVKAPDMANLEQQYRMVDSLIKQRVDGIAISPVDPDAMAPLINRAEESGIPVICFETDVPQSRRSAFIGNDNDKIGKMLAEAVVKALNGKGMIIGEIGNRENNNMQERLMGFQQYLAQYPEIKLLDMQSDNEDVNAAVSNLESMIEAHPHFDAFVGFNSSAGEAAVLVWKAKNLRRLAFTFGDMPKLLDGVRNEQIEATLSQGGKAWGEKIWSELNELADHKTVEERVIIPVTMITADSLGGQPN